MQCKTAILACVLISGLFFADAVNGEALDAEVKLAEYAKTYEQGMAAYEAQHGEAITSAEKQYISGLEALETTYQEKGVLEGVLLLRKELDRFKAGPVIKTEQLVKTPASLLSLQQTFIAAVTQANREQSIRQAKLKDSYYTALSKLKKELTQQNQIDAALKVSGVAESVKQDYENHKKLLRSLPASNSNPAVTTLAQGLREKLILHYSMDQVVEGRIPDLSDSGLNGRVVGAKQINDRWRGQCLAFDGNDHIDCGKDPRLSLRDNFTVSIWIRPEILGGGKGIVSKYYRKGAFTLRLGFKSNPRLTAGDYGRHETINTPLKKSQWHHVAAVMKDGVINMYLNGRLENSSAKGRPLTANNESLKIGTCYNTRFFKGTLDELRIYARPLRTAEVQYLARN